MQNNRIARVLQAMQAQGLTQMIVSDSQSIDYLTGVYVEPFERLFALYLRADGRHIFFLNKLFTVPETPIERVWFTDTDDAVGMIASRVEAGAPLGIDKTWPARFLLPLMERLPGTPCRLASDCVDGVRACKDAAEQELMRENSRINDEAMRRAAAYIREGMTEREVADYLLAQYQALGCEGPSFPPIVSFGANAADPHHEPDGTRLAPGDVVLFDVGCRQNEYCADMTRTFVFGEPTPKQREVHDTVRRANEAARALVRPGARFCDIDRAARQVIEDAGYGPYFTHRLGHQIGLDVHEPGDVSATHDAPVEPGMCFSIEPGIYLPGEFGVRIEDLVLVTEDGCEVLNSYPREIDTVG